MLFNSYSYEILYEQFCWIYLQGNIKLLLVTVNNRLKFEIEIVHDLSCHPIQQLNTCFSLSLCITYIAKIYNTKNGKYRLTVEARLGIIQQEIYNKHQL